LSSRNAVQFDFSVTTVLSWFRADLAINHRSRCSCGKDLELDPVHFNYNHHSQSHSEIDSGTAYELVIPRKFKIVHECAKIAVVRVEFFFLEIKTNDSFRSIFVPEITFDVQNKRRKSVNDPIPDKTTVG